MGAAIDAAAVFGAGGGGPGAASHGLFEAPV